jgi:hypothetical protein
VYFTAIFLRCFVAYKEPLVELKPSCVFAAICTEVMSPFEEICEDDQTMHTIDTTNLTDILQQGMRVHLKCHPQPSLTRCATK